MTCFLFLFWAYKKPTLYIFVPGQHRAHVMSRRIRACSPNIEVRVFPRYRPFQKAMQAHHPEGLLLLPASLINMPTGYVKTLVGAKSGSNDQPYVFLGFDRSPKTIGVLRMLPRSVLPMFLERKLGYRPGIKTVAHSENLLALLQFNYVDAVFLPDSQTPYLAKRTHLPLVVLHTGVRLQRPIILTRNSHPDLVATILGWPDSINDLIGVTTWEVP